MLSPRLIRVLREVSVKDALDYSKSIVDRLKVSMDLGGQSLDKTVTFSKGLAWIAVDGGPTTEDNLQVIRDLNKGETSNYSPMQTQKYLRLKELKAEFDDIGGHSDD